MKMMFMKTELVPWDDKNRGVQTVKSGLSSLGQMQKINDHKAGSTSQVSDLETRQEGMSINEKGTQEKNTSYGGLG